MLVLCERPRAPIATQRLIRSSLQARKPQRLAAMTALNVSAFRTVSVRSRAVRAAMHNGSTTSAVATCLPRPCANETPSPELDVVKNSKPIRMRPWPRWPLRMAQSAGLPPSDFRKLQRRCAGEQT